MRNSWKKRSSTEAVTEPGMATQRPLTVHLVRHGETEWNRDGRCQGVTDIPLTEKGIQQAEALGQGFAATRPSLILASPLQRAQETAARLAQPHGSVIETVPALQEWDQGDLEGLTSAQLLGNHTEFFQRWQQDPAQTPPPGGETLQELQRRAWPIIDQLRERAFDGPVVVVSHTMTIATIVCAALGLDLGNIHHLKIDLASRSTIVFSQFGMFSLWRLALLNDRQHLDAGLR